MVRVALGFVDDLPGVLLVSGSGEEVMAIDFEVVHYGDPSFDIAFLLNHLLLKMLHRPGWREGYAACAAEFWRTVEAAVEAEWLEASTIRHLGCLLLARIDGKSPAEYIKDPARRDAIRARARDLILNPPASINEVFECESLD